MSIAVVTDSTAYLSPEERKKYNIFMIPLSVTLEDGVYEEEIEIQAQEFYDKVRNSKVFPKTSQPPIGKFVELFETLAKDYDEVICIHLSSGISGTFQSALQAGSMVEGIVVHGFDSEISCAPQGYYAIQAAKMAQEGKSSSEILEKLEEIKRQMRATLLSMICPTCNGEEGFPRPRPLSEDCCKSSRCFILKIKSLCLLKRSARRKKR